MYFQLERKDSIRLYFSKRREDSFTPDPKDILNTLLSAHVELFMASTCLANFQYRTVYGSLIIELRLNHNLYHQTCTEICPAFPNRKSKISSLYLNPFSILKEKKKEKRRSSKLWCTNWKRFHVPFTPSSPPYRKLKGKESTIVRNFRGNVLFGKTFPLDPFLSRLLREEIFARIHERR